MVVLLLLLAAHLRQLLQEGTGFLDLEEQVFELQLLLAEDAVVPPEHALLLFVLALHRIIGLLHLLHVLLESSQLLLLCRDRLLQVGLEGVAHVLENADDLSALRGVRAGEGRLEERVDHRDLLLRHKRRGGQQGLLHRAPELHQARTLEVGHVLLVISGGPQCLVGAHLRQHLDRLLHLPDRALQVLLQEQVRLVLLLADLFGFFPRSLVLLHV
mmetsp:Transcript_103411/g.299143  ORF Transcript_103411/g.299143 Transcript_103411/m.299143 type:complete len:215 (-) Transcript_103411:367-1011(-)